MTMRLGSTSSNVTRVALLFVLFAVSAFGRDAVEQRKIDYLIGEVAALRDATFVRNGSEYSADRAADHLRMKLRHVGEQVRTAQDFIVECATASSMSGIAYRIRYADGRSIDSAAFLRGKLAEYEARAAGAQ